VDDDLFSYCGPCRATPTQRCAQANAPAAWRLLRPFLDDGGCQDWTTSRRGRGGGGGVCDAACCGCTVDEARRVECGVLVHCLAGISRSVSVTVAYLMSSMCLSLDDAYTLVKRRRPHASPSLNFMGQLLDFEASLFTRCPAADTDHCNSTDLAAATDNDKTGQ